MKTAIKMNLEEIKRIPLLKCRCGGKPVLFQGNNRTSGHGQSDDDVGVSCKSCGKTFMKSDYSDDKLKERYLEAIEKWNKDNT